ncbi:Rid family detoxifying hydrolase [Acidiferrobacter sp.]|uniref:Rid family detoxifying hydrolase n=1 Tax=Acidiferrobacter sp. TaxID=1872107 RepID=UPI002608E76F|nr:Rid family detoxifying hydrolase [Acidiferrobacter sp.]
MAFRVIETPGAPRAIGTYSQALRSGSLVFLSGQIPLDPGTMTIVSDDPRAQIVQVFENLEAVILASGGELRHVVKLSVFLTDLTHFPLVNEVMASRFKPPYPARSAIGVAALPRGALVEMDAILDLG